ncbi:uncharacterized protein N7483_012149 [Penicillium malachiteum]|uniref:uncharacterized protein n=1 Tax=Penicillium malachiteum TaxID=1324776 RepID=UPI00254952C3|nr:uncharacterized protein N7483_012149 [Penicillium malachiteum]KAJ5714968.1 hypothetical protein N7483_012149 [Penicillium malachiteum]
MTTPENAYQKLANVFSSRGNQILEIEMISSALETSFLQDELFIGITKKMLVAAYTVARKLFTQHRSMTDDEFHTDPFATNTESSVAFRRTITEIMLLFDCEHLSACNWRKRWLKTAVTYAKTQDQIISMREVLETELTLLTTYQCSPLHRHTKSPTLWSHRLWVLRQMLYIQVWSIEELRKLEQTELQGVLRAAELHPKNYYAFSYMRQLHTLLANTPGVADRTKWAAELAGSLVDPVLEWCLSHPRDISGCIFLRYLLFIISDQQIRRNTVGKVIVFARDIGWEGESLWTFVDQAIREFDLENILDDLLPSSDHGKSESVSVSLTLGDDQYPPGKWPWLARLARAKSYWSVFKQ